MRIVKLLCVTLSACLALSGLLSSTVSAQSVFDANPPVIELDETREGIAGETQVFTARVVDDLALKDVTLYYRFAGQEPYANELMTQLGDTDYFSANVATEESETRTIEYYIQARDEGGNRVIKGFAFEPYLRYLSPPEPGSEVVPEVTTEVAPEPVNPAPVQSSEELAEAAAPQQQKSGGFKWWYLVLGIIAAGGIAAAASSGGSDNGGTATPTPVQVTVTAPNP